MDELQVFTDPFKADEFIEKHVCSSCWGLLIKVRPVLAERRWIVQCEECQTSTRGYVTRRWAQQCAEHSHAELSEAKTALRAAVPWLQSNKPLSQICKELGLQP